MSYADFRELVRVYVLGCKEWQDVGPMISREDWKKLFDQLLGAQP